jgi:hypothetical protein
MMDIERVVTLDDLVESVPEALIREAEQNRLASEENIHDSLPYRTKESHLVTKDQSKAQRIREYMEENPEARNKDIVEALRQYKVTAADVANVKSLTKRSAGKRGAKKPVEAKSTAPRSESTPLVPSGAGVSLTELEAGVAFVKSVGSLTRAKHVLIILETIKDAVK